MHVRTSTTAQYRQE